jgi:GNAT superfamily N-acetyltransferase
MEDREKFVQPGVDDWREFMHAAAGEGWRVPATEIELFCGPLADSAIALRCGGLFLGLITLVNHGHSAWVGNLIVPKACRGRGHGQHLLDQAILLLEQQKTRSIWLTASESGFPLYLRRGFEIVGQVDRWVRPKVSRAGGISCLQYGEEPKHRNVALRDADQAVWGEPRALLNYLLPKGRLLVCGASVALLQREPGLQILGPWFGESSDAAERRRLLALAAETANIEEEFVIDLRTGSLPPQVLQDAGFVLQGRTRLMARGDVSGIDLNRLVSFASLGSMG